jgi:hypothetical protein
LGTAQAAPHGVDETHLRIDERALEAPPLVLISLAAVHIPIHPRQDVRDPLRGAANLVRPVRGRHHRQPATSRLQMCSHG